LDLPNYKSAISNTSGPLRLLSEQCAVRVPKHSGCLFDDPPSPTSTAARNYDSFHHLRTKHRSQSLRSYSSSYASGDDRTVSTTLSGSRAVDRRPESQASSATSCCRPPGDSPDWLGASTSSTLYNEIWRSVTPKSEIWNFADLQSNIRPEPQQHSPIWTSRVGLIDGEHSPCRRFRKMCGILLGAISFMETNCVLWKPASALWSTTTA